MAQLKKEVVALYDDYSASVRKCRRELVSEAWFGDDWWINNSFGNNGFTFQLSKTHWFNHESQGIHFEFWIGADEASTKTLPIVLHFEPDVPDRRALGDRFEAAFEPFEQEFVDYRINHRAICDKLTKEVGLSKAGLAKTVLTEFRRLVTIAPLIDQVIAS